MSGASAVSIRSSIGSAVSAWLPVLLWALLIAEMSTDDYGASMTLVWVNRAMRFLWPDIGAEAVLAAHAVIRKLAHLVEYAIFAVLLARALRSGTGPTMRSPTAAAIGMAAVLALLDEGNQSLSTARTGALLDCVIDVAGATVGALLVRGRWS